MSLLPTPQAMDTAGAMVGRRSTSGYGPGLRDITDLLPTPKAGDATTGHNALTGGRAVEQSTHLTTQVALLPTPRATDGTKGGPNQRGSSGDLMLPSAVTLLPTPTSTDHKASGATYAATDTHHTGKTLTDATVRQADRFGQYGPAVARWESILGRPAPSPTEATGKAGAARLSPRFVEWMMGLPDGWVTGESVEAWRRRLHERRTDTDQRPVGHRGSLARQTVPLSRNEALKALGNGVVPHQAAAAIRHLLVLRDQIRNSVAA